jgi:Gpi18-like mannosyltransferase
MGLEVRVTKKILLSILLIVLISRAMLLFTGYLGINLFAKYSEIPTYQSGGSGSSNQWTLKLPEDLGATRKLKLEDFMKFDTYSYVKIAKAGYDQSRMDEPHTAANWVFFPLFPLLLFLIGKLFWVHPVVLGIILSNLFLFIALVYLFLICLQRGFSERQARTVTFLVLIYPSSLYFSVPYTESLFLLLSAASIYYASNKQYALAFLAASLSTVTRMPGFINLAFVLGNVCLDQDFRLSKAYHKWALYSFLSLVPLGAYLFYMYRVTGDFLAPFHEQSLNWFRYTTVPFKNYIAYLQHPYFSTPDGWDNGLIAFTISTAVLLVFIVYFIVHFKTMFRDLRQLLFYVYGALLIIIPFSSQPYYLVSIIRYLMVCIPFYIYLVSLTDKRENALRFYQILFITINVIITIASFNGYYFVI